MNILEIEKLTYESALEIALETMEIKEHQVILTDLGGYYGYSALVFKNGKHVYYANDYQLHHEHMVREKGRDALRKWYINSMKNKLFTDAELMGDISSYAEYQRKEKFLRNYYIMRHEYVSIMLAIDAEEQKKLKNAKKEFPFYNPVSFCYVKDKSIVAAQKDILLHLLSCLQKLQEDNGKFREMVAFELANHEAGVTCSWNEALRALGISYETIDREKQRIVREELGKLMDKACACC